MIAPDFSGVFIALRVLFIALLVLLPFAIWKLIECVIWLATHLHIS